MTMTLYRLVKDDMRAGPFFKVSAAESYLSNVYPWNSWGSAVEIQEQQRGGRWLTIAGGN